MDIVDKEIRDFFLSSYQPPHPMLLSLRQQGERALVPIIMRDTESVLGMLLRMKRPSRILEVGTAIGYSAMFFPLSCPEAEVYTIEQDPQVFRSARANIQAAGLDHRIHSLLGDGAEEIDKLRDKGINGFDLVFLDAGKSHYRRFLDSALAVIASEALIVADNILIHGMTVAEAADPRRKHLTNVRKMREYLDYVLTEENMMTTLLPVGDGLAITEIRTHEQNRTAGSGRRP